MPEVPAPRRRATRASRGRVKGVLPVSLGCPKAQEDLERLLGALVDGGYAPVDDPDRADLIVIGTCAFLDEARREADEMIEWAKRYRDNTGGDVRVVVAGCLPSYLKSLGRSAPPDVDWILLPEEMRAGALPPLPGRGTGLPPPARVRLTPDHRAYLKIAEGCSNRCAYCLVPTLRGPFAPRAWDEVVGEARELLAEGVREITLIAQDPTSHRDIGKVLRGIDALEGVFWIRLLYLHPAGIDDAVIDLFRHLDHLVPYFDLPLQHFSPGVLRAMNRRGWEKDQVGLVARLAELFPDAGFRGTFIVGFPGETERDVQSLLEGITRLPFDQAAVFPFSPQTGTAAEGYAGRISPEEMRERVREVQDAIEAVRRSRAVGREGSSARILVEGEEGGRIIGRAPFQAPEIDGVVIVEDAGHATAGTWLTLEIVDGQDPLTLVGRVRR